jgi:hypothetical protein
MFDSRLSGCLGLLGTALLIVPFTTVLAQESKPVKTNDPAATAARTAGSAQQAAQQDAPPAADLSGKWIFNRAIKTRTGESRTQVLTMTLKQDGNRLSGEASYTTINVNRDGIFPIHGWIEGDQVGISAWVDWEGGEAISVRLTYQDGRLTGTKKSTHDAPHKWSKDDSIEMSYSRATD